MTPLRRWPVAATALDKTKIVLAIVIGVCAIAALYISIAVLNQQNYLREVSRYNITWVASQAVNELLRLETRIAALGQPDERATRDEVQLRLDILHNRLGILRSGDIDEFTQRAPAQQAAIARLAAALDAVDALMPTIEEPATIVRALAALRPLEPVLIGFAAAANEFSGTEIAADQQNLLRLHWLFSALAVVLILCGAALIVLLFIQHSAVRQAHRELRAATDDLRVAKDAAEAANETKSRFLANMSHELRTPLNAIIGFSEFMMMEPLGPLGHGKYRGYLSDILKSGKHMFELVTDILTMARLDAGRYELAPEPVALRALAEASIRIVEGTDMGKGRDIALAQPGDWPTLNVDDRAVRQMLINLVTNAVKFSDADTPVRIACRRLATGEIELTVTDRGIGMTARHIEMAVQPFQQIDSGMTRKYEGTGLGLSIVKALIEVHGGRLAIASTPGVGTEISLLFPARLLVEERLADVA